MFLAAYAAFSIFERVWHFLVAHSTVSALLASAGCLLCSRQDKASGDKVGAIFWQLLALFFLLVLFVIAITFKDWPSLLLAFAALGLEVWFLTRQKRARKTV
jgi:hypothetical protein